MEPGFVSSETVSWKALREAEKLEDNNYISQLIEFISTEKNKEKRNAANFILGHLAKKTGGVAALNFLIARVEIEKDKYIISSLLDGIADIEKPAGVDLMPLFNAAKSDKWLIRHSAINSLNHTSDPAAEAALIDILEHSTDPYDVIYTNAVLNNIGTPKSIPFLEKHLNSRKRDVKQSAQAAIDAINKRTPSV